jgi:F0F1-type ATP synthase epsilon subunit
MTFTVRLLSPDISQEITACNHVMLPAVNGDISILTGHSRLVTVLKTGVFFRKDRKRLGTNDHIRWICRNAQ